MTVEVKEKPTKKDYDLLVEELKSYKSRVEKVENKAAEAEEKQKNQAVSYLDGKAPMAGHQYNHNSLENKCLAYFGVAHPSQLVKLNMADEKYKHADPEYVHAVLNLKRDIDISRMMCQLFKQDNYDRIGATESLDREARLEMIGETAYAKNFLIPRMKAFTTGGAGSGQEWLYTITADNFISEFELSRQVIGQLVQVNMPSSPYEQPTLTGQTTARIATENVTATENNFNTGKITFSAKKFLEYYVLSDEITQDSAPDILAAARTELGMAHERAFETSVINGDNDGTHQDSDTQAGAADLAEKQYNGLRKLALANTGNGGTQDFANGVVTDALLRATRTKMKLQGVNPADLLWIMSPTAYQQAQGTNNVVTIDKLGDRATVITGALTAYAGIPIVVSGYMREDLADTGVHDGVTTDRTGLLLINRRRWYFGTRRPVRMAIRPSRSADDRFELASYSRTDFQGHPQSASEISAVYGINIST